MFLTRYSGALLAPLPLVIALGCEERPSEPEPRVDVEQKAAAAPETSTAATSPTAAEAPPAPAVPGGDPMKGSFTLEQATNGLEGKGTLVATLETDHGAIECELFADKAPLTVANFVGLARGNRPWKNPAEEWVEVPAYDRTVFHRVIKGFMIQGGDALGTGAGEPGYSVPDEVWPGAKHDRRGQLCMANRGPNTNGAQFFITDGPAPHLDGGFTIFGQCGPDKVIESIANVPTRGDRPIDPPKITKVSVSYKSK